MTMFFFSFRSFELYPRLRRQRYRLRVTRGMSSLQGISGIDMDGAAKI